MKIKIPKKILSEINSNEGISLQDITIVPTMVSEIDSRDECFPFCERAAGEKPLKGYYPIFTSPMTCVIDENNYELFEECKINTVIPRGDRVSLDRKRELMEKTFVAISLKEAENLFLNNHYKGYISPEKIIKPLYICIDVADGHMNSLITVIGSIKAIYREKVIIMSGNIANPLTYIIYFMSGCDYVRVGIGGGSRCTTASNSGVFFPLASLISRTRMLKVFLEKKTGRRGTKLIADGGISNFDDINKALSLGADYVMIGKLFAECVEACGQIYRLGEEDESLVINLSPDYIERCVREVLIPQRSLYKGWDKDLWFRDYYGMSTERGQRDMGLIKIKTSEGISIPVNIKHTLKTWVNDMDHYLRTAMSYTGSYNLKEFRNAKTIRDGGRARVSYFK